MVGSVSKTIGALLKALLNVNFALLTVGQSFAAITFIFTSSSRALLARSDWFAKDERVLVLSFADAAQTIGYILGFFVPTCFVSSSMTEETYKASLQRLFYGIASVCLI